MIAKNTLRTSIGYIGTLVSKYLHLNFRGDRIEDIFNYVPISENIGTSGQPTPGQFAAIRDAGYEVIVNLRPDDTENALANEAEIIRELGMDYAYIPVNFRGPTQHDYSVFVDVMNRNVERKIWVHCAVNARVSVFVARYRHEELGLSKEQAQEPIAHIWEPYGVWRRFLDAEAPDQGG